MLPRRRLDVVAVLPQAPVDLVHVLVRRLDEADVERLGVLHPAALAHPDQRQDRSVVVEEDVEVLPAGYGARMSKCFSSSSRAPARRRRSG
jgi:hypothetical protein